MCLSLHFRFTWSSCSLVPPKPRHCCILCEDFRVYASISGHRCHFERAFGQSESFWREREGEKEKKWDWSESKIQRITDTTKSEGHICVSFILCHRQQITCFTANGVAYGSFVEFHQTYSVSVWNPSKCIVLNWIAFVAKKNARAHFIIIIVVVAISINKRECVTVYYTVYKYSKVCAYLFN